MAIRSILRLVDIVIGTEDEINATMLTDPNQIELTHSQVSDTKVHGDVESAIDLMLTLGPEVILHKRGIEGVKIHLPSQVIDLSFIIIGIFFQNSALFTLVVKKSSSLI